jgi:hypothetical protein
MSTPSGQLVHEATEYIYSARTESVKLSSATSVTFYYLTYSYIPEVLNLHKNWSQNLTSQSKELLVLKQFKIIYATQL